MHENEIAKVIVNTAVNVHKATGPGLLETVYEVIMAHELKNCGLKIERQVAVPIYIQRY